MERSDGIRRRSLKENALAADWERVYTINEFGKGEDLCPSMSLQHHAILGWKQF